MRFKRETIEQFNGKRISEKDLDDVENGLVGNFEVKSAYRYRACDENGITDLLRITFIDNVEVIIFANHKGDDYYGE